MLQTTTNRPIQIFPPARRGISAYSFARPDRAAAARSKEAARRIEMIEGAARMAEYGRTVLDLGFD
jgi:hypothetical protein